MNNERRIDNLFVTRRSHLFDDQTETTVSPFSWRSHETSKVRTSASSTLQLKIIIATTTFC